MLSYNDQYNILAGVYVSFNSKIDKRTLSVSHKKKKRDSMKAIFPYCTYESWSRENFIVASLYIMFKKSPSSLIKAINFLREIEEKEVQKFKNEIIYYRKFLQEDINKIKLEEPSPSLDFMIKKYTSNQIYWFTFYFYLVVSNTDIEKLTKSRVQGILYKKIRKLLLYVTFSQKSMNSIKQLMKDTIAI